jgi:hypothetical protein
MKLPKAIKPSKKIFLHVGILCSFFFLLGIFALSFRKMRDTLPPPEISEKHIVGYSHFFGYPFFLDTAVFFFFMLYPLFAFFMLYLFSQIKKRL